MDAKPGDLIAVEAEHVGQPEREGEILEVIQGPVVVSYRVRWTDGHETMLTPAAGAARFMPKPARNASTAPAKPRRKPAPKKPGGTKRASQSSTG